MLTPKEVIHATDAKLRSTCGEDFDILNDVCGGFYQVGIECGENREYPVITVFAAAPDFSSSEKWKRQHPEQVVGIPKHTRVRHVVSVGECYNWDGLSNTEIMDRIMPVKEKD